MGVAIVDAETLAGITTWSTVGTVVVAVVAILYTRLQARSARIASQVDSARSGREFVAIARAAYDREDCPTFTLAADGRQREPFIVTVTMVSGPPEIHVDVTWTASSEGPGEGEARQSEHLTGTGVRHRVVRGDRFKVRVGVPAWADEATIRLDLACTDAADESRTWSCPCVLEWKAPPRTRIRWV